MYALLVAIKSAMILTIPGRKGVEKRLHYVEDTMNIPRSAIIHFPQVFRIRMDRLQTRHKFLKQIKRDQFDPSKPNYVSLDAMLLSDDETFCQNVAKSTIGAFNDFLLAQ